METQQQMDLESETGLDLLTPEEIGMRMTDCKVAMQKAERYYRELEGEMLSRLKRKETLDLSYTFVIHTGEEVEKPVTILHKSRTSQVYDEVQIIRLLKEMMSNPYADGLVYTETPKERLDRKQFERDLQTEDDLEPLRRFVTQKESDWCEVKGVPK